MVKKFAIDILQLTCYQQDDIRMRRHCLGQLVDDMSVASCQRLDMRVHCQNVLSSGLLQVVLTSLQDDKL